MKRLYILLALMICGFTAKSQNDYGGNGGFGQIINGDGWLRPGEGGSSRSNDGTGGSNILKINTTSLPSNVGLTYERVLTSKISLSLSGSFKVPDQSGFFDFDGLSSIAGDLIPELGDTVNSLFSKNAFDLDFIPKETKWFVMPEVRYYFKEAPRGFYTGLFFKYREYAMENNISYRDATNADYRNYEVDFQMNTASAGLGIGVQSNLLKWLTLDIYFIGVQFSSNIGSLSIVPSTDQIGDFIPTNTTISSDVQSGAQTVVNFANTELPVKDIFRVKEISSEKIELESRFTSPSIRLPSVRIGIRF